MNTQNGKHMYAIKKYAKIVAKTGKHLYAFNMRSRGLNCIA